MKIVKLDQIDSTNSYFRETEKIQEDFTVVWAEKQTKGRGQRGTKWESEEGKNLTFSILKRFENLSVARQFTLSQTVALSVFQAVEEVSRAEVKIKWPNDIILNGKKIGGILIENTIEGKKIKSSVIGIGLNVNQREFKNLERASSMAKEEKREFEREKILTSIIKKLENNLQMLIDEKDQEIYYKYCKSLFKIGEVSKFKTEKKEEFQGVILGVSDKGELKVQTKEGEKRYEIKEISLVF